VKSKNVLVVAGPTASGKSALALEISSLLDCEIISADSRQVHTHMTIGTAQPPAADLDCVPHHFVAEITPSDEFNAGAFGIRGRETIAEIFSRKHVPLVVGGSGLYLRSLLDGLFDGPEAVAEVREELESRLKHVGPETLLGELREVDPVAAARITSANPRRIIRALEVHQLSGRPLSELQRTKIEIPFDFLQIGLNWSRPVLYERINKRVIAMVNAGLVEETRRLLDLGYAPRLRSMLSVGYREALAYLEGSLSHSGMIGMIQMNTRRFAKRQLTWFRRDDRIRWFDVSGEEEFPRIASEVVTSFRSMREKKF